MFTELQDTGSHSRFHTLLLIADLLLHFQPIYALFSKLFLSMNVID